MQSPFAQTVESESIGTGLAVPLGDPNEIFKPGGSATFITAVQEHVAKLKPDLDISTEKGREFIRSTAYKITRTKTYAYGKAKGLADSLKARAKEIVTEAEFMSGELTKLSHEVRGPLTARENKEAERAGDFETKLGEIYNACLFVGGPTIKAILERMNRLTEYQSLEWAEYGQRAQQGFDECFPALQAMLATAQKAEADRVELEELRLLKAQFEPVPRLAIDLCPGKGEAIPPRPSEFTPLALTSWEAKYGEKPKTLTPGEIECETMDDLSTIIDIDQAADTLAAIKAGKIRHVQIVY